MITLSEEQEKKLRNLVERGEADSLAEALNDAILAYCQDDLEPIDADPRVLALLDNRRAEGPAHVFDSVADMDSFLRTLIAEKIVGKVEA